MKQSFSVKFKLSYENDVNGWKKDGASKEKKRYLKYVDMYLKTCQTPPNTVHFFTFHILKIVWFRAKKWTWFNFQSWHSIDLKVTHKEDDHKDEIKHMIPKSVINAGVLLLIHWFAKDWKNLTVTENPKYISKQCSIKCIQLSL